MPIPVPHGSKAPVLLSWQNLRVTDSDLPLYFNGPPQNIGVLLGEPSGGLVDVDSDSLEALVLTPVFLPPTGCVFGRPSKTRSHREYVADPLPETAQFKDTDGTMLVELRSTGCQTLFPPSIHPSGEGIIWEVDAAPARVEGHVLRAHIARLAAAALLARHWPAQGSRQETALALAGGLLRGGWPEP